MVNLRAELVKACMLCVNLGLHFILIQHGTECVTNQLAVGEIVDSAQMKFECKELAYNIAFPNISLESDEKLTTSTISPALPVDDLPRCLRCVKGGLKYIKTKTGSTCLSDFMEEDPANVVQRAATVKECRKRPWNSSLTTTTEPSFTTMATTMTPTADASVQPITAYVIMGCGMALGLMAAGAWYIRKFVMPRILPDDQVYFPNMMYRPTTEDDGGVEMSEITVL